ncbi:acyltransferase family protein [Lichenicoccus sp.]|uniref:acyltransferase family protein n=1 Tax=Lichenicoccus sp. TaxID=2781899 RepID=UPI003D0ADF42
MNHLTGSPARGASAPEVPARDPHHRIADIELLRGAAITMVVIEHLHLNLVVWRSGFLEALSRCWQGWTGVDLFLAISGFVIGRSLLPTLIMEQGIGFLNRTLAFWTRRAWRLLPLAWLWLLIPLLASIVFNKSGAFGTVMANYRNLIAAVLDVANFRIAEVFGKSPSGPTFPYWSLSLEEQFYLVLPLLILVFRRRLPWVLGLLVVLQFVEPHVPLAMLTRTGALAVGVLLAFWSGTDAWRLCEPSSLRTKAAARFVTLVLPLLLLGAIGSEQVVSPTLAVGLVALVAGILVWLASYDRDYLLHGVLPRRVILWLGSRSYAIYLIHIPAFAATREIWFRLSPAGTLFDGRFAWRFAVTALVLVLGCSEVSHRLVEYPLRRRGVRIARQMLGRIPSGC